MENKDMKPLETNKKIKPTPLYMYWLILIVVGICFLISGYTKETSTKTSYYGEEVMNLQGTIMQTVYVSFGWTLSAIGLTLFLREKAKDELKEYELSLKDNQK